MINKEEMKKRMLSEGFSTVDEYDDPANEVFPDHNHPGDQLLYVLKGSISITMNDKHSVLTTGEEFFFPAKMMHEATVGPDGCLYLVGERPEAH